MTRRGTVLIISSIVVLATVAGIVGWWRLRPTAVVAGALDNMAAADTYTFTARLEIENSQASAGALGEQASISLAADGAYDRRPPGPVAVQATVTAGLETETVTMVTEAEARFIDDAAYVLIKKMPPALSPLSQLKGQWLKLPRNVQTEESSLPADEPLITDITRAGTAEVAGERVRIYNAVATPAAVLHFFDSIGGLIGNRLTTEQIDQFRQTVAAADGMTTRLAVNPWNRELKQIEIIFTAPVNQNQIHATLHLTDRNKEVSITAPSEAKSVEELAAEQAGAGSPPVTVNPAGSPVPAESVAEESPQSAPPAE
ncbi:MAG: hypothetical protein COT71_03730 [Candidatus Andersenbacteria bacterium CG10_big_fil_rev_8_21_14_0_10_54_11]|uniref:LppX_LprAFG lipoprotein n=1 Tax=Candidatus Andersenbacteria bacterium CG10_big_fil_rev_8_21_14_0_10_54_11 TaxID=1974485 RepID=A0A2M6WYM3_9BACT|nr:MAG: hypothetical protein COT71_03730 [Candidatus Andersenbacteria bacterium CG10_big_fil_rev_8_21_14_0_10_54_11]